MNMKNKSKKLLASMFGAFFCVASLFAANNEKGIEYFRAELYDAAKIYFNNQIKGSQNNKAEAYFYLGECYAATEKPDSAVYYYQKASEADPEYSYAYIAEAKIALQKNDNQLAQKLFDRATKSDKKNPEIYTAVAEAYIAVKKYDLAEEALEKARKADKNYSGIYVAEGDMLMQQGKTGDASAKYENAILFNKEDKVAYLKEARVYKKINPTLSLEILDRLVAIDPEYIPAYAEIGEINYDRGYYADAIKAYAKFISIPGVPIKHRINYASLLYFTKDYVASLAEIRNILVDDPKNVVMHRLQAYNNYELGNYPLGLEQMETFLKLIPAEQIITLDYIYYGRLLDKTKNSTLAIENFQKALAMDENKVDIYKEIAVAYSSEANYPEAVNYYQKYIEKNDAASLIEVFNYGVASYNAANQFIAPEADPKAKPTQDELQKVLEDSTKRADYLIKADGIFAEVSERSPDSYLGYLWRARANAGRDLTAVQGLAKPFYEQSIEKMKDNNADGKRNRDLIECYSYLGYYYYVHEDIAESKKNWVEILAIDPENTVAKQAMDGLK